MISFIVDSSGMNICFGDGENRSTDWAYMRVRHSLLYAPVGKSFTEPGIVEILPAHHRHRDTRWVTCSSPILRQILLNSSRAPFHSRSTRSSFNGTSSRSVANCRKKSASCRRLARLPPRRSAPLTLRFHFLESSGMDSIWPHRERTTAADFAPHPGILGYPSALPRRVPANPERTRDEHRTSVTERSSLNCDAAVASASSASNSTIGQTTIPRPTTASLASGNCYKRSGSTPYPVLYPEKRSLRNDSTT